MKTPKKLKVWKRKLDALDYCLPELENHGFQYRKRGRNGIWVNDKDRVVIKQSFIQRQSSVPAVAPPTIIIPSDDENYPFVIQVLCYTPTTYNDAEELVFQLEKRIRNYETDIHINNVGRYRNKPVLFDW